MSRDRAGYEGHMTHEQISPFVGRNVAAHLRAGNVLTGRLYQPETMGPYEIHSIDGEVPPTVFLGDEIDRIDA